MLEALPPVVDARCRVLVLGSMPGAASLAKGQYYGHPRNALWPILYRLLAGCEPDVDYERRTAFALAHGVALWDVLRTCEREGSLDAAIREPVANDFRGFLAAYPAIRHILFNGRAAAELFRKQVKPQLDELPRCTTGQAPQLDELPRCTTGQAPQLHMLPSTSPAMTIPFTRKCDAWSEALEMAGLTLVRFGESE